MSLTANMSLLSRFPELLLFITLKMQLLILTPAATTNQTRLSAPPFKVNHCDFTGSSSLDFCAWCLFSAQRRPQSIRGLFLKKALPPQLFIRPERGKLNTRDLHVKSLMFDGVPLFSDQEQRCQRWNEPDQRPKSFKCDYCSS